MTPIRVAHIITELNIGGAEMMLYALLHATDRDTFTPIVVSLQGRGALAERIEALGVPIFTLDMRPSLPNPLKILALTRLLREQGVQVAQTWMYHANLIGGVAARRAGIPVLWAVHSGVVGAGQEKRTTLWIRRLGAPMSRRYADRVVYVSEESRRVHEALGYAAAKSVTIPNGFDLERFHPSAEDRQAVRAELNIPPDAPLIGYAARFHVWKGHDRFIQAAAHVHRAYPDAHFLFCGKDNTWENAQLAAWIDAAGIRAVTHLLGRRDDVPRLLRALDVFALASIAGEAFPMVVGEAMASGVPCVVTGVGDSALIVGEAGRVVPPGDELAFADALMDLLSLSAPVRRELGDSARAHITAHFALPDIAARYGALYQERVGSVGKSSFASMDKRRKSR